MTGTTRRLVRPVGAVAVFAAALGATSVLFPLVALDAGVPAALVGTAAAASAGTQLVVRVALPWLLHRLPDRTIMVVAAVLLGVSAGVVAVTAGLGGLIAGQAIQGSARALFWTANQTHVLRLPGVPVRRLAQVQLGSRAGRLAGTAGAGWMLAATGGSAALAVTSGLGLVAAVLAGTLAAHPPYARAPRGLRRRGLGTPVFALGSSVAIVAGGWRAMLDSFVPVLLAERGLGSGAVGVALATSDAAGVATNAVLARRGVDPVRQAQVLLATASVGVSAALVGVVSGSGPAAVLLAIGGAGGALAAVLGSALVNEGAPPEQQGTALALAGAYRAASRLAVPLGLGALTAVMATPTAFAVASIGLVLPPTLLLPRRHRDP